MKRSALSGFVLMKTQKPWGNSTASRSSRTIGRCALWMLATGALAQWSSRAAARHALTWMLVIRESSDVLAAHCYGGQGLLGSAFFFVVQFGIANCFTLNGTCLCGVHPDS